MDVDAEHVEPEVERLGDNGPRLGGRQSELRAVVAGADRLVGVGVDAERDAHEHALHTRRGREPRLVGRVEDDRRPARRGRAEERLVLVVAVDDEPIAVEPRTEREGELSRRTRRRRRCPRRRSNRSRATFGNAFVPKNTRPSSPTAARSARAFARSVSSHSTTSGVPCSAASASAGEPADRERCAFESGGIGEQR